MPVTLCTEDTLTDGLDKTVCLPLALMISFVFELSYSQLIIGWEVIVSGVRDLSGWAKGLGLWSLGSLGGTSSTSAKHA